MSQGEGEGLNASPLCEILKKMDPLFINSCGKIQNLVKKDKILKIFDKKLIIFQFLGQIFEANFVDSCDYHKSVQKNLEIFKTPPPPKSFQKEVPTHNFWPYSCMTLNPK